MEDKNILTEGIETLYTMKENILELNGYQEKIQSLEEEERSLENEIAAKEKLMNDEITSVVKKRKDEITLSFDEQLDKTVARKKRVKVKKDKLKDTKISERVKVETSEFEEEKVLYNEEIKEKFKVNSIPRIFNSNIYYTLFLPRSIKDIFFIILTLGIILLGIPLGIYKYMMPHETKWLVIVYIITFLVSGSLYIAISRMTKEKHRDAFTQIRLIRNKYADSQKRINRVKKAISKDKDESGYGLEKFDNELNELEEEIMQIAEAKKNALVLFESSTKFAVSDAVKANYEEEIQGLKEKYDNVYEDQRRAESMSKEFSLEISKKYEAFIGKESLSITLINELIQIMETGQAATIAEAISQRNSPSYALVNKEES